MEIKKINLDSLRVNGYSKRVIGLIQVATIINGKEEVFEPQKIIIAVTKANNSVIESARLTELQIKRIAEEMAKAYLPVTGMSDLLHRRSACHRTCRGSL